MNPTAVVPIAALVLPMIDCFLIIFEALFACCHCEFIGWNSTLTLIINLFGLIVSSGIVQSAISYYYILFIYIILLLFIYYILYMIHIEYNII